MNAKFLPGMYACSLWKILSAYHRHVNKESESPDFD